MIAFFGLVTTLNCGLMSLPEMGCTAMVVNAAIRLVVDRLRNDAMDKAVGSTTIFAGCQLFLSSWAYFSVRPSYDQEVSFAIKATACMMGTSLIFAVSGRAVWLRLAQSPIWTKLSWLLKPIVFVYLFSFTIVLLSIADAKDQSTAGGSMLVKDTQWGVLSHPSFLLSVLLTGIIPMLVS
ncbi:hypothetical protein J3E69DRAFT_347023 [Trichoderma sp. SZMC 28015]